MKRQFHKYITAVIIYNKNIKYLSNNNNSVWQHDMNELCDSF